MEKYPLVSPCIYQVLCGVSLYTLEVIRIRDLINLLNMMYISGSTHFLLKIVPKLMFFHQEILVKGKQGNPFCWNYEAKIVLFVPKMREGRGIKINQVFLWVKIFTAKYVC